MLLHEIVGVRWDDNLTEEQTNKIKTECGSFLSQSGGLPLFRGVGERWMHGVSTAPGHIKGRESQSGTDPKITKHINDELFKKLGFVYRDGICCSGDIAVATLFGAAQAIIIPKGAFKFGWSPIIEDWGTLGTEPRSNPSISATSHIERIDNAIQSVTNTNLQEAIKSGNEVVIYCDEIYIIPLFNVNDEVNPALVKLFTKFEDSILHHGVAAFEYAKKHKKNRWPELEKALIADKNWNIAVKYATYYIKNRWPEFEENVEFDELGSSQLVEYVTKCIKGRWDSREADIKQQPHLLGAYTNALKSLNTPPNQDSGGPLDDLIQKYKESPVAMVEYAMYELGGKRWPEAEPYIMVSPLAAKYAINILHRRWPEAEPYIMVSPIWATEYADLILDRRWPEAEPYIMKDPLYATLYSKRVIKDRWPEAEPYIMKDAHNWKSYKLAHNIK